MSGCTSARVSASTIDTPAKTRILGVKSNTGALQGSRPRKYALSESTTEILRRFRESRLRSACFQGTQSKTKTSASETASTTDTPIKERVFCAGSKASERRHAFSGVMTAKSRRFRGSRLRMEVILSIRRRATLKTGYGNSFLPQKSTRQLSDRVTFYTLNPKIPNPFTANRKP